MARKGNDKGNQAVARRKVARSLAIAKEGIQTSQHFAQMMSALMSDLIEGRLSPVVGNAVCNAGSKLLRIVELQHRYGTPLPGGSGKMLNLAEASK